MLELLHLQIFWSFLKLGTFAFGGAYGAIPLFRAEVLAQDWMTDAVFTDMVAISESTPGPMMVNMATYIGSQQAGFLGGFLASIAVVLPSFLIILFVIMCLKSALDKPGVQRALLGIQHCVVGLVLATAVFMAFQCVAHNIKDIKIDFISIILFILISAIMAIATKYRKKGLAPIPVIIISGILGGLLYSETVNTFFQSLFSF